MVVPNLINDVHDGKPVKKRRRRRRLAQGAY